MRRVVGAVVVVALVAGLGWAAWWWTHPTVLRSMLSGGTVTTVAEVGRPLYVGLADADRKGGEVVTLTGAEVDLGGADGAAAGVVVCTRSPTEPGSVGVVGQPDLDDFCRRVRPVGDDEVRLDLRDAREQLLLRVEGTSPGRVDVEGVTVGYRGQGALARRGLQRLDADVVVTVR